MTYTLESKDEWKRLESQSQNPFYDYQKELSEFILKTDGPILDAGSGSGVVSRYLAQQKENAEIIGYDFSADRIVKSRLTIAGSQKNISFVQGDLLHLPFSENYFSGVVCRYVIEHFSAINQIKVIEQIFRCLKPGGWVCIVDLDGMYYNLYPTPKVVSKMLKALEKAQTVDLQVGRKLPYILSQAQFSNISWKIELMNFQGKHLEEEAKMMSERLDITLPYIATLLKSEKQAAELKRIVIDTMHRPGTVLFYNKFIVMAQKPTLKL